MLFSEDTPYINSSFTSRDGIINKFSTLPRFIFASTNSPSLNLLLLNSTKTLTVCVSSSIFLFILLIGAKVSLSSLKTSILFFKDNLS